MPTVHLLDYVAGNIRSLVNAIEKVGYNVKWIRSPEEVAQADVSSRLYQSASAIEILSSLLVLLTLKFRSSFSLASATLDIV